MKAKKLVGRNAIRTAPVGKDYSYTTCPVLIKSVNDDNTITINNGFSDAILNTLWNDSKWKPFIGARR